jgi:S-adenosylmethionine:tRNA ribosyltransferase-isomerase
MVLHRETGKIEHCIFKDILQFFDAGDVLVFNNTRVFPARLYGRKEKTGARIEVFLLRELDPEVSLWDVIVEPARKIRIGNKLYFGEDSIVAEVIDNTTSRGRTIRFLHDKPHDVFKEKLYALGVTPLPMRTIRRAPVPEDAERYQTIYATEEGAVAAPAAGLHFSRELMMRLRIKDCQFAFLTAHMGMGNFAEIDVEDLTKHKTHSEQMLINAEVMKIVNKGIDAKKRVCAVGVCTMRALETAQGTDGHLKEFDGWTNRFIFPPYTFGIANAFLTNFHEPYSTMLMMAAAFGGLEQVMGAYKLAIEEKYRFGAYGDAMLIL